MGQSGTNVPAALAAGVLGLVLGFGAGVVGMVYFGNYRLPDEIVGPLEPPPGGPAAAMKKARGGGGGGKGAAGMARGGAAKTQLAALVTKLDLLTARPIAVTLTADQKAKLRDPLKDLADLDELSDAEAQRRLDAVLAVVEPDRPALEAVGYRFGGSFTPPPPAAPNPFKLEPAGAHLQALRERVGE